jgi:putative hydrolase of the HAD superfamily
MDADGVLINSGRLFSHQYAQEQGMEAEQIEPFFQGTFQLATIGKADLKELIAEHRDLWKWDGTPEELLHKWFTTEANLDSELIEIIQQLRADGVKVYLASDQEKYRAQYFRDELFAGLLDGFFISCDLGYEKKQPEFFKSILAKLDADPSEVLFFDDSQHKVDSARAAGIQAEVYSDRSQVTQLLARTH